MSVDKKKQDADTNAAQDDIPAAVVKDDVARAVSDSAGADVTGPQPPRPGDANYKTPELWGRGKADPTQVGDGSHANEEPKHGQKHTKRPATEA